MATVDGTSGDDARVLGTTGDDTINGLEGNDLLEGGQGRDTYVFDSNFGRDIVSDDDGSGGANPGDVVHFRADNLSDVISAEVTGGGNLVITTGNGTVNIRDFQSDRHGIETIRFRDTTAFWNGERLVAGNGPPRSGNGSGNDGDNGRLPRGPRTVSIDDIDGPSLNNPDGTMIEVRLRSRPITFLGGLVDHTFVEVHDPETNRTMILDSGPSGGFLKASNLPASQSDEDELAGDSRPIDTAEIRADFDEVSDYADAIIDRLNEAGVPYVSEGVTMVPSSNTFSGDVFELTTGKDPVFSSSVAARTPGLRGTVLTGGRDRSDGNDDDGSGNNSPLPPGGPPGGFPNTPPPGTPPSPPEHRPEPRPDNGGGDSDDERDDRGNGEGPTGNEGCNGCPPLVLDLDRDGSLDLISNDRGGWVGPSDGFLAVDRDGSGAIDDVSEIAFVEEDSRARTDLEGLAYGFDGNGDGVVNNLDERFAELQVFQDTNGDGVSEPGELMSLQEAGITSIDVSGVPYEGEPSVIQEKAGNQVFGVTTVAYDDGSFSIAGDVALGSDHTSVAEMPEADVTVLAASVDNLVNAIAAMPAQEGCSWRRNGQIHHPTPTLLAA